MLAARRLPQLVRSHTLIEPGAYRLAAHHPIVAAALQRNREGMGNLPKNISPKEFLHISTEPLGGIEMPTPTPQRLRAARSAMRERPCWEAEVPVEPLATAVPGASHEPHQE